MTLAVVLLICGGLGGCGIAGMLITVAAGSRRRRLRHLDMNAERRRMLIEAQQREDLEP